MFELLRLTHILSSEDIIHFCSELKNEKKIEKLIFEYKLLNVHTYSFTFFLRYFGAIDLLIPQIV